ncbi:MAG: hypothetical protein JWM19_1420 [Actinomycetia bacterium]|nr:hypothetical protein [Actinomycetes bacterium]
MRSAVCKQSGKGLGDGVASEVTAFFDVLPGHQEELRAAARRFTEAIRNLDPAIGIRTGLRDTRHVIFDDGRRLLWCASFEGEWDKWVDDGLFLIGAERFLDWLRHTAQGEGLVASVASLTAILQSVQAQAAAYFDPLGALTLPQIVAAQRLFRRISSVNDGLEEASMTMKNSTGHPGVTARRSRGDAR